jgi:hypothetical protein
MGKGNPGAFRRGADPRRHALTPEERRKGFEATMARIDALEDSAERRGWLAWLKRRMGAHWRGRLSHCRGGRA